MNENTKRNFDYNQMLYKLWDHVNNVSKSHNNNAFTIYTDMQNTVLHITRNLLLKQSCENHV